MSEVLGYKNYDHKNRNPFDNRKNNFRLATAQENARNRSLPENNTSGFIGVSLDKETNKWLSYIGLDNKQKKLGRFIDKEDAIRARLCAEKELFLASLHRRNICLKNTVLKMSFWRITMTRQEKVNQLWAKGRNPIHLFGHVYLVRRESTAYSKFPWYVIRILYD